MAEQKPVGPIEVLGPASKYLNNIRFLRLLFLFKLEQFTFCGASAALDLPLRQWRNGSSSGIIKIPSYECSLMPCVTFRIIFYCSTWYGVIQDIQSYIHLMVLLMKLFLVDGLVQISPDRL
jgi:hypothetical protein